jgi:hypothetical protein
LLVDGHHGVGRRIVATGIEGAGSAASFGVHITRLFGERAAAAIAKDANLMNFKCFFTPELAFIKELHEYASLLAGLAAWPEAASYWPAFSQARRCLSWWCYSMYLAAPTAGAGASPS